MINPISILVSAGHRADLWVVRGIAIGGMQSASLLGIPIQNLIPAICFVVSLHGFTPRLGVYVMNVSKTFYPPFEEIFILYQALTLFKTVVLLLIVVTGMASYLSGRAINITSGLGWIVLSGKTRVKDPHVNFHHAFAGSSNSGHDVCTLNLSSTRPALIFS